MTAKEDVGARSALGRRVLWLGVFLPAALGLVVTFLRCIFLEPRLFRSSAWVFSKDLFVPLPAAKYVAHGAIFSLYEPAAGNASSIGYPYTPGLPVVLSPFAWLVDRFELLDSLKYPVAHPGAFVVVAPAVVVVGIIPLLVAVGKTVQRCSPDRIVGVQWAVCLVSASATLAYFHPEDGIACAGLFAGATAAANRRWRCAGAMLAAAILFKQWAIVPAAVVIAAAPSPARRTVAFYALAIPALVMTPFLLLARHATMHAMTGAEASLQIGQRQVWTSWIFGQGVYGSATPLRLLWLVGALGVAWFVRNRPELLPVLGAIGIVMLARLFCEPAVFAYYLAPPFAFAVVCAALMRQPIALRAACGIALQLWCGVHSFPPLVWWMVLIVGCCYVCAPLFEAVRREADREVAHPAPPVAVPSVA